MNVKFQTEQFCYLDFELDLTFELWPLTFGLEPQ
jgi:hypothetical protein